MFFSYGVTLLVLCPLIFLASFIDAIAGGGGLISLPAYVFVGIPIHNAYGTNKFPSALGTSAAVLIFPRRFPEALARLPARGLEPGWPSRCRRGFYSCASR